MTRDELKALADRRGLPVDDTMLDAMARAEANLARLKDRLPKDLDPSETPAHLAPLSKRP